MDLLKLQKIQANHNLSDVFHISGLYLMMYYKDQKVIQNGGTEMIAFNDLVNDEKKRNEIWSNCKNMGMDLGKKDPKVLPLIEDLMVYEQGVWDATFCDFDLRSYHKMRVHKLEAFLKAIKSESNNFLNRKFQINKDELFEIVKTKWNWYSHNQVLPSPRTPPGEYHYFIRPTLFRGTVMIKNLMGIDALIPILINEYLEFDINDIIDLIRNGATPDYIIPDDEKDLKEDIILFLREQIVIYNSINIVQTKQKADVNKRMKSYMI